MNPIQEIIDYVNAGTKAAFARGPNNSHCCSQGCYHCCKEPAYASESEMRYALELLSPDELSEVREQAENWLRDFLASDIINAPEPSAFKYRALCLYCPLLKDGNCRVYERRPLACRLHYATGSPEGCKDDAKRAFQKFALFPGLMEKVMNYKVGQMQPGDKEEHDHIGLMLAKILLGKEMRSKSYMLIEATESQIFIHKWEDEQQTTTP